MEFCYKNCCDHRIRTKIYLHQIQQYFNVCTENGYSKPKTRLLMAITKTLGMPTRSTPESSKKRRRDVVRRSSSPANVMLLRVFTCNAVIILVYAYACIVRLQSPFYTESDIFTVFIKVYCASKSKYFCLVALPWNCLKSG